MVCVEPPQILLQKSTLGDRADEMEALLKRHDAFEKLLNSQDDKVRAPSPGAPEHSHPFRNVTSVGFCSRCLHVEVKKGRFVIPSCWTWADVRSCLS